ncbi:sugar phosphorylase [Oceanicoccus sagamiensis]|uniref:Alpha-amylase n=1 Tax=Oceanicoccus sagamiensis TaxID=716816 RepID=A0A1X9N9J9_9GAMM|nr:sugar phosphorylase [Oceanicoccus sagamiensis]ARN73754.1 alpha-amylase [Oceanicoccus sagamiensis]
MPENSSKPELLRRMVEHISVLYPNVELEALAKELISAMGLEVTAEPPRPHRNLWDQADCLLITYGNSIVKPDEKPLTTLKRFIDDYLQGAVNSVHILPFFPYSSDDGFSVMDYLMVNPALGDWEDITAIADNYKLMSDVVINHMSARSRWFDNFKKRLDPGKDYFFEAHPDDDLSEVVRPRNSPLLTEVETADGSRYVWCTFSADQVDLNFKNPAVLAEFVNIIRHYLSRGVKIFRMDAVAFLWKEVGTPSIHLQETHEIIKLLRTLVEHHSPDAVIITETNVPNRENLTYFGNANEAHIIYNFSLPPLLLYTLLSGDCRHLKTWMMSMPPAQAGTAYLNFIASHDGIGLRPLDGLVDDEHREELVKAIRKFGGKVTYRKSREGVDKAYEINIALYDALKGTMEGGADHWQSQRFICAHLIMMALEGVPAFYIHSLIATENDYAKLENTGHNRSINRHVWQEQALYDALADKDRHHQIIFEQLGDSLRLRCQQPAFHPNATQFTLHLGTGVFAFWRQSIQREQSIFCLSNVTRSEQLINLADINLIGTDQWTDLLSGETLADLEGQLKLSPYQTVWLSNLLVSDTLAG